MNLTPHIRWMAKGDLGPVLMIESDSSEAPWVSEDFREAASHNNRAVQVAEVGARIVGFMVYELHRGSIELLNLAVHTGHRRQGIGRALVKKLLEKLSSHRRTRLTLHVTETNLPAQLFFRELGFRAVRVERRHYDDGEDAYAMEFELERPSAEMLLAELGGEAG